MFLSGIKLIFIMSFFVSSVYGDSNFDYYGSSDIYWGQPASEKEFIGQWYRVVSSHGPNGSGEFPITRNIEVNLSETYQLWVKFDKEDITMTSGCAHFDENNYLLEMKEATVTAKAKKTDDGYIIRDEAIEAIKMEKKLCGITIKPGKYLIYADGDSIRMYTNIGMYAILEKE